MPRFGSRHNVSRTGSSTIAGSHPIIGSISMSSGARPDPIARASVLAAVFVSAWTLALARSPGAPAEDLDLLMAHIASAATSTVRYREEKTLSFLDSPLVSHGTLRFEEPDKLIREIDGSTSTRYLVTTSSFIIEEGDRVPKEVPLDDYPALRALMQTVRAVLVGDLAVLEGLYRIEFAQDETGWTLGLDPRDTDISRFVSKIKVSGRDGHVRAIETLETGGDRVLMTFLRDAS